MNTAQPLLERQRNALRHASRLPFSDPLRILLVAAGLAVRTGGLPHTRDALKKQFYRLYIRRYCAGEPDVDVLRCRMQARYPLYMAHRLGLRRDFDKTPIKYLP